ncbi:hypothetical protein LINPERHAP1_LOCUS28710 [Linum perenne]
MLEFVSMLILLSRCWENIRWRRGLCLLSMRVLIISASFARCMIIKILCAL